MSDRFEQEERSPTRWVIPVLMVGVLALAGFTLGADGPPPTSAVTDTTLVPTTGAPTTVSSSVPGTPTTSPTKVPRTTQPPTTDTTATSTELPDRAIAQQRTDIVGVDPLTGQTEVVHGGMFEASWATNMGLSPDGSRLYYQLTLEDYWFSCDSASGDVVVLDLASGDFKTIARGMPALSPDGERLAYLGAEECYPDPKTEGFFLSLYDTLVITDLDANEIVRFPLATGEPDDLLTDLLWMDDTTVLVSDEAGSYYRVPVEADEPIPIVEHETLEISGLSLGAVLDGLALAAEFDPQAGHGPLLSVDLSTGTTIPIQAKAKGPYAFGVSAKGRVIVSALGMDGEPLLVVDVDPSTGQVGSVLDAPQLSGIDW